MGAGGREGLLVAVHEHVPQQLLRRWPQLGLCEDALEEISGVV